MKVEIIELEDLSGCKEVYTSKPHPFFKITVFAILLIFVVAIIWAAVLEIDIVVEGAGNIVSKDISTITNVIDGPVELCYVKNGDYVTKGTKLYEINCAEIEQELQKQDKISNEVNEKLQMIDGYLSWVKDNTYKIDQLKDNQYYKEYTDRKNILLDTIENANNEHALQISQYQSNIGILENSLLEQQEKYKNYKNVMDAIRSRENLFSKDEVYYYIVEDYLINYDKMNVKYSITDDSGGQERTETAEEENDEQQKQDLLALESKTLSNIAGILENIEATVSTIKNSIRESKKNLADIQSEEISTYNLQKIINSEILTLYSEKQAYESKQSEYAIMLTALQNKIEKSSVYAPKDGYVNFIGDINEQDYLLSGISTMTIIPDDTESYIVEAYVSHSEIGQIKEGMQVNCDISTFPAAEYGYVIGEVTRIFKENNEGFYKIFVKLNTNLLKDRAGQTKEFINGLSCDIKIITDKKTILIYILDKINLIEDVSLS